MYFLPISRHKILQYMPHEAKVAEIGVASGEFSKLILEETNPKELHLIDPWQFQDREDYIADPNNVDDGEQERRFKDVSSTFAMEVMKGQVQIHRRYSINAAELFDTNSLDWLYLDAMHTYEGVLADLRLYESKLSEAGFFLCDDFTNNTAARNMNFGVVEAVREFTISSDWHLIAMTNGMFPNCLLSRDPQNESTQAMVDKLLSTVPNIVIINDPWNYRHEHIVFEDGQIRLFPAF